MLQVILHHTRYGHLQDRDWLAKNLEAHLDNESATGPARPSQKRVKLEKTKVTVCGKSIWNYSSQASMSRNGWLQFSVLAKDCDLRNAVELCRNWDEFSQLNFLTAWQYFPASNWVSWGSDTATMQLHELVRTTPSQRPIWALRWNLIVPAFDLTLYRASSLTSKT